jgi:dolichyl-phosphate-mannose--protein O-mannosyl transferase
VLTTRLDRLTACWIFILSLSAFLLFIQFPTDLSFDEVHYIPAAKRLLSGLADQNAEHPPLGKFLIATGIRLWGDQPLGWRGMSAVFGALSLVGIYAWALALFGSQSTARFATFLTFCNGLLYVQSRIAMLDTFMVAFLMGALATLTHAHHPGLARAQVRNALAISGVLFGLAIACKWAAVPTWLLGLCAVVFLENPSRGGPSLGQRFFALGVLPVLVYSLTFLPSDGLISSQVLMWDRQLQIGGRHPYLSHWTSWPWLMRPIWYSFKLEPGGFARGVVLLQNPLIAIPGIFAIFSCAVDWIRTGSRSAGIIALSFCSVYLSWMVIPRGVTFYYYYYPAGMILGLALAQVSQRPLFLRYRWYFAGAAFALFLYFFPLYSGLRFKQASFSQWMWFKRWI